MIFCYGLIHVVLETSCYTIVVVLVLVVAVVTAYLLTYAWPGLTMPTWLS